LPGLLCEACRGRGKVAGIVLHIGLSRGGTRQLRIEAEGKLQIGKGRIVLAPVVVRLRASGEGLRQARLDLEGAVEIGGGKVEVAAAEILEPAVQIAVGRDRIGGERFVEAVGWLAVQQVTADILVELSQGGVEHHGLLQVHDRMLAVAECLPCDGAQEVGVTKIVRREAAAADRLVEIRGCRCECSLLQPDMAAQGERPTIARIVGQDTVAVGKRAVELAQQGVGGAAAGQRLVQRIPRQAARVDLGRLGLDDILHIVAVDRGGTELAVVERRIELQVVGGIGGGSRCDRGCKGSRESQDRCDAFHAGAIMDRPTTRSQSSIHFFDSLPLPAAAGVLTQRWKFRQAAGSRASGRAWASRYEAGPFRCSQGTLAFVIPAFAKHRSPRMLGIGLAVVGYFLFSLQDAAVKWLVADRTVWEILFVRSITITVLCLAVGRGDIVRQVVVSGNKGPLLWRGAVILAAWLCYYRAARNLQLAELVTIYFAAPLMVTTLSVLLLKEQVRWPRWAGTGVGFVGVVVACQPGGAVTAGPVLLTLLAALLWAYSNILVRRISAFETTLMQMLFANAAFVVICGATLPWTWTDPPLVDVGLMAAIGVSGAAAQYLLLEGFRLAPASLIAPFEYTSLLSAFALSFLIWGDIPRKAVFAGAALIIASGVLVIASEWRDGRRRARSSASG